MIYIIIPLAILICGIGIGYIIRMLIELNRLRKFLDIWEEEVMSETDRASDPVEFDNGVLWAFDTIDDILTGHYKENNR